MANTLLLRLEGPLQSWGERGRWSVRDTAPEPTKSGIVGLLGCALGLGDDAGLRALSEQIRIGVRCDRPGELLTDYHTVGGGYAEPQLLTAEGKPKWTATTKEPHVELTWRQYLCDASFLAAIRTDEPTIERLAAALAAPVWVPYLGRKSCPPSAPYLEGIGAYAGLVEALETWPWRDPRAKVPASVQVRAVMECGPDRGVERRHALVSRSHRMWGPIYTEEQLITIQVVPLAPQDLA